MGDFYPKAKALRNVLKGLFHSLSNLRTLYRTNHASFPLPGGVRRSGFARIGQQLVLHFLQHAPRPLAREAPPLPDELLVGGLLMGVRSR